MCDAPAALFGAGQGLMTRCRLDWYWRVPNLLHFGGMPHFDDCAEQGHLNLLGSRYSDGSRMLRVDADLKGLPEPLVDAGHDHVDASPPVARMYA